MAATTLLVSAAASLVTGAAFVVAGLRIQGTVGSPQFVVARRAHAAWWGALGAYLILQAVLTGLAGVDALAEPVYRASRALAIPLLCVAVWGLCTYLGFLYTGSARLSIFFGALYCGVAAVFAYATFVLRPQFEVGAWLVGYAAQSTLYRLSYVLVGAPPIFASLAYLSLLPRVQDPQQRRRLVLTSVAIIGYVGSGLSSRLFGDDTMAFVTLVPLGLLSAVAVLAAHGRSPLPVGKPMPEHDEGVQHRMRELI